MRFTAVGLAAVLLLVLVTPAYALGLCDPGRVNNANPRAVYTYRNAQPGNHYDHARARMRDLATFIDSGSGNENQFYIMLLGPAAPYVPTVTFGLNINSSGNFKFWGLATREDGGLADSWTNDALPEQYGYDHDGDYGDQSGTANDVPRMGINRRTAPGGIEWYELNLNGDTKTTLDFPVSTGFQPTQVRFVYNTETTGNQFGGTTNVKFRFDDIAVQNQDNQFSDDFTIVDSYGDAVTDAFDSGGAEDNGEVFRVWDRDC